MLVVVELVEVECGQDQEGNAREEAGHPPRNSFLADTSGFNQPTLLKVTKQSLAETFRKIRKMIKENNPPSAYLMTVHLDEHGYVVKGDSERYHTICRCLIRSRSENHSSYEHLEQKEVIGTKQVLWA